MKLLYFAYGSNMLLARLKARCPSARTIGTARANGYALEFTKPGRDKSGKATLVSRERSGISTPGVLFEITGEDLVKLDQVEGNGYQRHDKFPVQLIGTGNQAHAATYLAVATDSGLIPYDWYLALLIAGAMQNHLDEGYVQLLRETEYATDESPGSVWRTEALLALADEGITNHNALLK